MKKRMGFLGLSVGLVILGSLVIVPAVSGLCGDCSAIYGNGDEFCVANPPHFVFCRSWEKTTYVTVWNPDGSVSTKPITIHECEAYGECAY